MSFRSILGSSATLAAVLGFGTAGVADAAPTPPGGAHPRLFLDDDTITAMTARATDHASSVGLAIADCDDIIAHPDQWQDGGYQGFTFIHALAACLVTWKVRGDAAAETAAVTYFRALLDDYTKLGLGDGGDEVVRHDSGYAMRTFGPYAAIAYDWLHDAPGVDETLRTHARERFAAWTAWYDASGYHNGDEAGSNYEAGYAFAEAMIAIAEAGEAGTTGDALWVHVVDDVFSSTGKGITAAFSPGGVLDGGDWLEGWQYGPPSVAEYAMSARALRANGVPLTGWSTWEGSMAVRNLFAQVPDGSGIYVGGDFENDTPYIPIAANTAYAILIDAPPPDAAAWAAQMIHDGNLKPDDFLLVGALAEARMPAPASLPPDASTWYYATGSRTIFARTSWSADALWFVAPCAPARVADHMFFDAGNLVLTRGVDHLIVDPTPYGSLSTTGGNAPTVASPQLPANYQPSQASWGTDDTVDFAWARQTVSGVIAARCEYAGQYQFQDQPSDIPSAVRDLVLLPVGAHDGVLVLVDDITGAATDRPLDLRLHSLGTFSGTPARATVGDSDLVVQTAFATGGTATTSVPDVGDCFDPPVEPRQCEVAQFAVGEWRLKVPAAHAQAITIVDAVAQGADPGSSTTSTGAGWRATEMDRGGGHIAVIAVDPGATAVTYAAAPGRHVIVGAPAGATGRADVSAVHAASGCDVTVTPRAGDGGFNARPVVIVVGTDCSVAEDPAKPPFGAPAGTDPGGGSPGSGDNGSAGGGCCQTGGDASGSALLGLLVGGMVLVRRRTRSP